MSNVIDFLERMGQDARLRYGSCVDLATALESEEFEPAQREAILAADHARLALVLGQGAHCCLMFPVKEGEEGGESESEQESPSREDEETTSRCGLLAVGRAGQ